MTGEILAMVIGGLILLGAGGEFVVRGGLKLARALRISEVIIGVALLGFGTSLPEMVTSVQGVLAGAPGISLGNVVGSNIANLLLITGVAAVLGAIRLMPGAATRDAFAMAGATALLAALLWTDQFSLPVGVALLAVLAAYLTVAIRAEGAKRAKRAKASAAAGGGRAARPAVGGAVAAGLGLFAVGLAGLVAGGWLLVEGAVGLAKGLGVSDTLIGVTVVAVGTSLPELATTVAAAARRRGAMALGNVFGSNIFNSLAIVGVTAVVGDLATPPELLRVDFWAMLIATAAVLIFALTRRRLSRLEGAALLAGYVVYVVWTARVALGAG